MSIDSSGACRGNGLCAGCHPQRIEVCRAAEGATRRSAAKGGRAGQAHFASQPPSQPNRHNRHPAHGWMRT